MSDIFDLKAQKRSRVGKGAARAERRAGRVPAVIYGAGKDPEPISLDFNQTQKLIYSGGFLKTLFNLDVDGQKITVIPKDYQLDVVKDFAMHVDFLRVDKKSKILVQIPVHVVGDDVAPGIRQGGALTIIEHSVELECPATDIPDAIVVDVSKLNTGDVVHISEVRLPEHSEYKGDSDIALVTISATRAQVESDNDEGSSSVDDTEE